jgi:hypothetical protein
MELDRRACARLKRKGLIVRLSGHHHRYQLTPLGGRIAQAPGPISDQPAGVGR